MFYLQPDDPAIFVSKRVGIGYTMNFANKMSWLVLAGMLLIALLPALLLKRDENASAQVGALATEVGWLCSDAHGENRLLPRSVLASTRSALS